MIPLRDNVARTTWPWVMASLIVVNCAVFFWELSFAPQQRGLVIGTYALIPARTVGFWAGLPVTASAAFLPLFTSMFLHGGWMHLIGNMWFLWIFGDNVEDRVGHLRFLALYVCGGLAGALTHILSSSQSTVPTVGASGAIAAVMGAYLITFPRARVLTLVPIFFFLTTVEIPAIFILLYWLLLQFLSGAASLGLMDQGGVAWFAHIGGFLAGVPLMLLLRRRSGRRSSWL
ncbi:MAG: rhomboid family intramembrane serine protease [Acidobacteria bacterium]|nr:rhomboid family intramembrane serine protease [Acidobacteriota bacterium]